MLARGEIQFALSCSRPDFSRQLLRGERPSVLVAADATDPAATGNALAALPQASRTALAHDLTGPLAHAAPAGRRRSTSTCSAATTRKASRSTTSCPGLMARDPAR